MSHIDDLIAEHCPDGVEFKTFKELFGSIPRGRRLTKSSLSADGTIPVYHGGLEPIGHHDQANTPGETVMIINTGASSGFVGWSGVPFWCSDGCFALPHSERVLPRYLYHYAVANSKFFVGRVRRAGIPTLAADAVLKMEVPIPPLEVQREIVRILDQFTALEAELEAELEARRRQYEHYLHAAILPDDDLEWTTLGDATSNHDRKRKPVTRSDRKVGEFPYYGANGIQDYVHDFIFDGTFLLVGEDGSVKNANGTPVLNWASGKIWVNNHAHVLTASSEQFSLRYLYYFLATVDVTTYVTGGTQPKINQKNLNSIPVPVVSRDFQDKVVEMLDRFDALVNDLSSGLPAEIAARRKQYEYYRDKLLTFKELSA